MNKRMTATMTSYCQLARGKSHRMNRFSILLLDIVTQTVLSHTRSKKSLDATTAFYCYYLANWSQACGRAEARGLRAKLKQIREFPISHPAPFPARVLH